MGEEVDARCCVEAAVGGRPGCEARRMLVQANGGGGKSWALRRILEKTHDVEGEFHTLLGLIEYARDRSAFAQPVLFQEGR